MNENHTSVKPWAQAEKNLGLTKSVFILQKNGNLIQYYDYDEGENFYAFVKAGMELNGWFDEVVEEYFLKLKSKDKVKVFECLAIFNEIDEHPEIATEDQLRRLKRIRESSHEEIYKLK